MTPAATDGQSEETLEHDEAGLDLPSLPVFRNGPLVLKQLTEEAARSVAGCLTGPTPLRRDDPEYAQLVVVEELVVMFGLVAHTVS